MSLRSASVARSIGLALALVSAGCQCRPTLPQTTEDSDPEDTSRHDSAPVVDTAPPTEAGPCELYEAEPNGALSEEMPLPTDAYLCGAFLEPNDFDYYGFDLPQDGWVGVFVDAQLRGSFADVRVTVTSVDAGIAAERLDDEELRDVHLVFPAVAGHYDALVLEQNLKGEATHYDYELLATVAKPPITPTVLEKEPNNDSNSAQQVGDGAVVQGAFDVVADSDWYKIAVPPGKHVVTLDVEGFALGSPANSVLWLYESGLAKSPTQVSSGVVASDRDPYVTYASDGNETVYFRLEEVAGDGGSPYWYGLSVKVEAP